MRISFPRSSHVARPADGISMLIVTRSILQGEMIGKIESIKTMASLRIIEHAVAIKVYNGAANIVET